MTLLLVKLTTCVDDGRFVVLCPIEEVHHIHEIIHAIDIDIVHHGGFPDVLRWHNESLELLSTGSYGDGQCTTYRLQFSIKSQLPHHDVFVQMVALHLAVGSKDGNGQWQVVGASLLANIGWRHVDCDISYGKFESDVLHCG